MTTIVLIVFLIFIVGAILIGNHIEQEAFKRKTNYPKAKREKLPKELEDSLDDFEKYLS